MFGLELSVGVVGEGFPLDFVVVGDSDDFELETSVCIGVRVTLFGLEGSTLPKSFFEVKLQGFFGVPKAERGI
jgi:adenine deaminase